MHQADANPDKVSASWAITMLTNDAHRSKFLPATTECRAQYGGRSASPKHGGAYLRIFNREQPDIKLAHVGVSSGLANTRQKKPVQKDWHAISRRIDTMRILSILKSATWHKVTQQLASEYSG